MLGVWRSSHLHEHPLILSSYSLITLTTTLYEASFPRVQSTSDTTATNDLGPKISGCKKIISWGACQNTESWVPPSRDSCSGTVEPGICLVILRQVFSGYTWSYRNEFHLLILTGLTQNHNTAFSIFKKFLCSIVDLQYCVQVSCVQQSDSVIYIFFSDYFPL